MSSEIAIVTSGLSKAYSILHAQGRPTTLAEAVTAWRPSLQGTREKELFWALRDVSLTVRAGEVVGLVGRNGAGKSTLLKVLSRITEPTAGEARVWGRVGSLLEVGTGFHAELTGRENIYLNGAILGMKRAEIARKFDEIVAFAEIERFLDTPVKRYSSGMYIRLAFAVAAHLDTEILLVDEVLAVGDAEFQKKCLGKMRQVVGEGRTVLFVSHNMTALKRLCQRAFWISEGRVIAQGDAESVVTSYLASGAGDATERAWERAEDAPGGTKVRIRRAAIRPMGSAPASHITVRTPVSLEFDYWNLQDGTAINLSVVLLNDEGVCVFNTVPDSRDPWFGRAHPEGLFRTTCVVPANLLNAGFYRIELMVVQDQGVVLSRHQDLLAFEVHDERDPSLHWFGPWIGTVRPLLCWQTEFIGRQASE